MEQETMEQWIKDAWEMVGESSSSNDVKNNAALLKELLNYDIQRNTLGQEELRKRLEYDLKQQELDLERDKLEFEKSKQKEEKTSDFTDKALRLADIAVRAAGIIFAAKTFTNGMKLSYLAANEGTYDKMLAKESIDSVRNLLQVARK